jgi:membrane protease YdiL (CAAX protease family)
LVTLISNRALAPAERLGRLEDPATDFPFYAGTPVGLSGGRWLFVMAAVAAGFALLVAPIAWPGGPLAPLIPAVLFVAVPLAALARAAPGHWTAIFGKVGWREIRLMLAFALLNLVVSMVVGVLVRAVTEVAPNAAAAQLAGMDMAARVAFFAKTVPQLFGEELLTLLPFLALMALLTRWFGAGRRSAVIGAWLLSSLVFGLLHLPTYDWNWGQSIVIIGAARMVLTLAYVMTKNIWVSTGAHIVNDWVLFMLLLIGAELAAGP